jgi:1-acyl-sn-glycerol-3-phosphate acyltransferase
MKWTNFNIKTIKSLLSSLWRLWFFLVFMGFFLFFIPVLFFFTQISKDQKICCHILRYWSKLTLIFSGVFLRINFEEDLDKNENYIICPNHISSIDIPIILASFSMPILFMAKKEYSKIPLFGWFYERNTIIVNRANNRDAYEAFVDSGNKLDEGFNVCIFPEGGIPPPATKLRRFKNGPFKLAIEKNIKIVPVTMPNNKECFPWSYFQGSPGILDIKIHKPVNLDSLKNNDVKNLNNKVYSIIFEELSNYEN